MSAPTLSTLALWFSLWFSLSLMLLRHGAHAHKDGAPTTACLTMAPGHQGTSPQDLAAAQHKLEFARAPSTSVAGSNNATQKRTVYLVTLGPKAGTVGGGTEFKGFFVQARSPNSGTANPVGTWETTGASGLARGVNCGGVPGSGVTHANSDAKPSVTLLWSPPSVAFSGKVVFVATVVKDYKTYWIGVQSAPLQISGGGSDLGGISGDGSGGGNSGSSTATTPGNNNNLNNKLIPVARGNSSVAHPLGSAKFGNSNNATGNQTGAGGNRSGGSSGGSSGGRKMDCAASVPAAAAAVAAMAAAFLVPTRMVFNL